MVSVFTKLEYSKVDMAKSGLVIEGDNGYYDRFKDRIMFALHDMQGKVIGFSGRIYKENQEGAKYINSPESDIFIKGQTLYHYHKCREAVIKQWREVVKPMYTQYIWNLRVNADLIIPSPSDYSISLALIESGIKGKFKNNETK